jgi:hypothetical protein
MSEILVNSDLRNFNKKSLMGVALVQVDRQTDMTRLIMALRNIPTNVPKNAYLKK